MNTALDNALRDIARLTGGVAIADAANPLSRRIGAALGWQHEPARLETRQLQGDPFQLARGLLGPQRAAVFASNGRDAARLLPTAARFAYHSSVHWGLVADDDGAVVFNSHWIRDEEWFRLPEIRWSEPDRHRDVLIALTPQGVATGRLDQIAMRIHQPDKVLTPVDDALVARLDYWRLQALRFGQAVETVDQDLHTLFAQFFVLRAVEDRGLAPSIPQLESVVKGQEVDTERLQELFGRAREAIQSQLFTADPLRQFPNFLLAGIIDDLYNPAQLPRGSRRYNFAWIDADVLGRAYEKYLANVFAPAELHPQLRLFEQPVREVEPVTVKKSGGIYYTPDYLVGALTEQAIGRALEDRCTRDIPRIADFACGSGSFLVEAFDVLIKRLRERDANRNWARTLIEGKHVVGIDIDPRAVTLSRLNLWLRFTDEPDALPLPSIEEVIVVGDSLDGSVWATLPSSYDIIVGNPPFLATTSIRSREELGKRFRTARGRFDYAHLFVELAVRQLAPGGVLERVMNFPTGVG